MFDFIDPNGSFLIMSDSSKKDSPKLGKILAKLTGELPFDLASLINREGGPVVLTQLKTDLARKFAKVALFQGLRLEVRPMASYYNAPEVTPKRIAFEDVNVFLKSEAPGEPDVSFPTWDIRSLKLGQLRAAGQKDEVTLERAQGHWSLKIEDVKQMVAEVTTPDHRIFLLPGKLLYQHLDPPGPNSAKNFQMTLNKFLEVSPACEADDITRDWCESRALRVPFYKNIAAFKKENLGELQTIMS